MPPVLITQTEKAIELFEDSFSVDAVAAFAFDNTTTHQNKAGQECTCGCTHNCTH